MPVLETKKIERMLQKLPQPVAQPEEHEEEFFEDEKLSPTKSAISDVMSPEVQIDDE